MLLDKVEKVTVLFIVGLEDSTGDNIGNLDIRYELGVFLFNMDIMTVMIMVSVGVDGDVVD